MLFLSFFSFHFTLFLLSEGRALRGEGIAGHPRIRRPSFPPPLSFLPFPLSPEATTQDEIANAARPLCDERLWYFSSTGRRIMRRRFLRKKCSGAGLFSSAHPFSFSSPPPFLSWSISGEEGVLDRKNQAKRSNVVGPGHRPSPFFPPFFLPLFPDVTRLARPSGISVLSKPRADPFSPLFSPPSLPPWLKIID